MLPFVLKRSEKEAWEKGGKEARSVNVPNVEITLPFVYVGFIAPRSRLEVMVRYAFRVE
jgi:hypothetical protein